jgi:hypothetical protein
MQSNLSSPWNNAVSLLEMRVGDQHLSYGSCFFWRHAERVFLVSNWHNLAGRNPLIDKPMSPTAGLPDRVLFQAFRRLPQLDAASTYEAAVESLELSLVKLSSGLPAWLEHPTFGKQVDVAAMDVTDLIAGYEVTGVNTLESNAALRPQVSQDIFILGYPFGRMVNAPVPIWKRGTIALDPAFDIDSLPKMLVDTATREGMSGSVVLARQFVPMPWYEIHDGASPGRVAFSNHDTVIGVYSGRYYPDHEKAQLGIVWKRSTIEETIAFGRPPVFSS